MSKWLIGFGYHRAPIGNGAVSSEIRPRRDRVAATPEEVGHHSDLGLW